MHLPCSRLVGALALGLLTACGGSTPAGTGAASDSGGSIAGSSANATSSASASASTASSSGSSATSGTTGSGATAGSSSASSTTGTSSSGTATSSTVTGTSGTSTTTSSTSGTSTTTSGTSGTTGGVVVMPSLFGYAHGNLATHRFNDGGLNPEYLDATALLDANKGTTFVRTDLAWDGSVGINFARYDALATAIAARHLRWLPNLHEATGNGAQVPASASEFQTSVRAALERYGPTGTFSAPNWQPVQYVEIWNEPNTVAGNSCSSAAPCTNCASGCTASACVGDGSVASGACTLNPATMANLIHHGANAVHAYNTAHGTHVQVIGPVTGSIDFQYLDQIYAADPSFLSYVDLVAVHVYPGSHAPLTTPPNYGDAGWDDPSFAHVFTQVANLRPWLDDHGGAGVRIAITEGGYSGSNAACAPPNVVTETQQNNFDTQVLNWLRASAQQPLEVEMFMPYNPLELGAGTCNGGYDSTYFIDHLGAVRADGTLKPWGHTFKNIIADAGI